MTLVHFRHPESVLMLLNVLDFDSGQDALDAAADGDRVYFPGIDIYIAPPGGFKIRRSIEIFGDGPGDVGVYSGTVFRAADFGDVFLIEPPVPGGLSYVHFRDFKVKMPPGNHGIGCNLTLPGQRVGAIWLERINVLEGSGSAFYFRCADPDTAIDMVTMIDCSGFDVARYGMEFWRVRSARVVHGGFNHNALGGATCLEGGIAFYLAAFQGNGTDPAGEGTVLLASCRVARVDACHCEDFAHPPNPPTINRALTIDDSVAVAGGSFFTNKDYLIEVAPNVWQLPTSTGIGLRVGTGPIAVLPNRFIRVRTALVASPPTGGLVYIDPLATDILLLPQLDDPRAEPQAGSTNGTVRLPDASGSGNYGLVAVPLSFVRAGLHPTSRGSFPPLVPAAAHDGMLYYVVGPGEGLRVRVANAWKSVQVIPI